MHRFSHTAANIIFRSSTLTALVILLAMAGLAYFLASQVDSWWHSRLERRLLAQTQTLAQQESVREAFTRLAHAEDTQGIDAALQQAAALVGGHITLLDPQGTVVINTAPTDAFAREIERQAEPDNELSRMPEVRAALVTGTGIHLRRLADTQTSDTQAASLQTADNAGNQNNRAYFIAATVAGIGAGTADEIGVETTHGIVRLAIPYAPLVADLRPLQLLVVAASLGATLVMIVLAVSIAERRMWKMRRLTEFAGRIAQGDTDAPRLLSIARGELEEVAQALNRTADRLKSQSKKRAREKDRLITIMHVMNDGVIILNKHGRVRLLNPAAERILQTSHERALGRSFMQTARDHRIAEVWERCRTDGHDEIAAVELGNNQFVRVIVTPFLKRKARGYLVILQDLTEVRRLQTIRQDFVSNVSHELRTPLASLRALVETLRDGAMDDPPAAERFLDRMEVEVDALTQMVGELLELSRIESGQVPLRLSVFSPADVLGEGAERLRPQTERADISLSVDVPNDLPEVLIDSSRIQQVVTNLVHNAIKFTPPGGSIRVSAYVQRADWETLRSEGNLPRRPSDHSPGLPSPPPTHSGQPETSPANSPSAEAPRVVVEIADTGMGIQPDELARIFERFYKTDRSRAMGGTGLGLAISKHIIQAHGGEIWAQSDGKSGSAFYFALPFAEHVTAQNLTASPASTATQDFPPIHAELAAAPPHSLHNGTPPNDVETDVETKTSRV